MNTFDNRDMSEMERYYVARIEALTLEYNSLLKRVPISDLQTFVSNLKPTDKLFKDSAAELRRRERIC